MQATNNKTSRKQRLFKHVIKMKQNDSKKIVERQTGGKRSKKRELFQKLQTPSKDLPNPRMLKDQKNSIFFWIHPSCPADKLIREEARRKSTSLTYPAVQLRSAENTFAVSLTIATHVL